MAESREQRAELQVREAVPGDLDQIVALWVELLDFHQARDPYYTRVPDSERSSAEHFTRAMESGTSTLLVAESENSVLGYLMAHTERRPPVFVGGAVLSISDICVKSGSRRGGVGVAMVNEILRIADEMGIERVEVGYSANNELSHAFWGKMGFKPFVVTAALERKQQ